MAKRNSGSWRVCLGFGLYWAWVTVTFYSSALVSRLDGPDGLVSSFWLYATLAHAVGLLAAAAVPARRRGPAEREVPAPKAAVAPAAWASAVGVSAGCALLAFGTGLPGLGAHGAVLLAACLVGLCSSVQVVCWGEAFACVPVGSMAPVSAAAFLAGLLGWFAVSALPDPARLAAALALPLASAAVLARACAPGDGGAPAASSAPTPGQAPGQAPSLSPSPAREAPRALDSLALVGALFVFALCGELLRSFSTGLGSASTDEMGALYLGGGVAGLALLCAYLASLRRRERPAPVGMPAVRGVLLAMAGGFLLAPFLGAYSFALCYGVFGAGFWCFRALSWMYCLLYVRRFGASPRRVVAVLDMTFALSVVASSAVTPWLTEALRSSELQTAAVCLVVVFTLMFISMFVLYNRQATAVLGLPVLAEAGLAGQGPVGAPAAGGADGEPGVRDARAAWAAARWGLTERESEVARLLSQGRTLPYIQEALCISAGTAQTHARHIYKKMGVHSKQELIDAFEGCGDEEGKGGA